MEQFKIIALEPLERCTEHILKNLNKNEKYFFYQGYKIIDDIIEFDKDVILPIHFFSKGNVNISINAIVGKNGSGKSALIELLMRVINNLSYIHNGAEFGKNYGVVPVLGVEANLYYQAGNSFYKIYLPISDSQHKQSPLATIKEMVANSIAEPIVKSNKKKQIDQFFYTILTNYSLYAYNTDDFIDESVDWDNKNPSKVMLKRHWIDGICHKNDGYSTPIVINPMRTRGNIDVNTEKHLTKSRLLSLLVNLRDDDSNSLKKFNTDSNVSKEIVEIKISATDEYESLENLNSATDEYKSPKKIEIATDEYKLLEKLDSAIDEYKSPKKLETATDEYKLFKDLDSAINRYKANPNYVDKLQYKLKLFFENKTPIFNESAFEKACCIILEEWNKIYDLKTGSIIKFSDINYTPSYNYLVAKTMNIINTYSDIICPNTSIIYDFNILSRLTDLHDENKLKDEIEKHIDAIYKDDSHIVLKIKQTLNYIKYTKNVYSTNKTLSIKTFRTKLNKMKKEWADKTSNLLYFMPPPFIKADMQCQDSPSSTVYNFNTLSSGEKQFLYSTSTILYHLRNLESTFHSQQDLNRVTYKYINIILEEIELYYHPEMQRQMIQSLIYNINNMNLREIKGININLITHSPIIISDIPRQNVLFLKNGCSEDVKELTLGANIHSLYKHSFFMDLPMGEFAKNKIKAISDEIYITKDPNKLYHEIMLIGEPIIRNALLNRLSQNDYSIKEKRIKELEVELCNLRNNNDKN